MPKVVCPTPAGDELRWHHEHPPRPHDERGCLFVLDDFSFAEIVENDEMAISAMLKLPMPCAAQAILYTLTVGTLYLARLY